jgi:hypothetical protein
MKKKFYTTNQILTKYEKLSLKKKIEVLDEALDYMQQYNGRSKLKCIALAIGYDNYEGEDNTWFQKQ